MLANEHIIDIIPDYALGMLAEADAAAASAHLDVCAACRGELAAYQQVLDYLPLAAPAAEPPAYLKQQVLSRIQPVPKSEVPAVHLRWHGIRQAFQRSAPVWAFASLVLVVFLGIINLVLWNQVRTLTQAVQEPAMQVVSLVSTDMVPDASGIMIISTNGEYGTLVVDHLPVLDEDQQYQLWLIRDGERTSGGVFSVYGSGYGVLRIDAPEPLSSYPAFGVTIEPAGGSAEPTGDRVLSGEL